MSLRKNLWFYACAVIVLLADQLSKYAARMSLVYGRPVPVIPGIFDLSLNFNSGAAFGVLPNWAPFFILVGILTIFAIVKLRKAGEDSRSLSMGFGLLLGGAMGNLIDRVVSPERGVTDFLSVHVAVPGTGHDWPIFNIADIGIVIGALLVFFYVYVIEKRRHNSEAEQHDYEDDTGQTQA